MVTDNISDPRHRLTLRRSRSGGFAGGGTHGTDRLDGAPREADEVDDAVDPSEINRRIRSSATPPARQAHAGTEHYDPSEGPDPRQRLGQVAMAGSTAFAKEYRLTLLHRMLLRGLPLDQIANQLGVSVSTAEKDRAELKKRLRQTARELDINEIIGNQTGLYEEISGMALRIASRTTGAGATTTPMQLAAMRTALAANADKARFYQSAGVFDVLRYRRAEDGSNISDVQQLMENTERMLQQLVSEDEAEPKRVTSRRVPRGFKPFSTEDEDSNPEVMDI